MASFSGIVTEPPPHAGSRSVRRASAASEVSQRPYECGLRFASKPAPWMVGEGDAETGLPKM